MGLTSYLCMRCERKNTVEDRGEKHPELECDCCAEDETVHFIDPLEVKSPDPKLAEQYNYSPPSPEY